MNKPKHTFNEENISFIPILFFFYRQKIFEADPTDYVAFQKILIILKKNNNFEYLTN